MTHNIGAPNSVARYLANNTFGANKYLVLERVKGELALRAASAHLHVARRFHSPTRDLVDIDNVRILPYVIDPTPCGICYGKGTITEYNETWECPCCEGKGGNWS
jgi:hypothetical protein